METTTTRDYFKKLQTNLRACKLHCCVGVRWHQKFALLKGERTSFCTDSWVLCFQF